MTACGAPCAGVSGRSGLRSDEDFQALAVVHVLVARGYAVDVGGGVEDLAGFDDAVEDVGHEFLDVGADRRRAAREGDVAAEEAAEADRCILVLWDADAAD